MLVLCSRTNTYTFKLLVHFFSEYAEGSNAHPAGELVYVFHSISLCYHYYNKFKFTQTFNKRPGCLIKTQPLPLQDSSLCLLTGKKLFSINTRCIKIRGFIGLVRVSEWHAFYDTSASLHINVFFKHQLFIGRKTTMSISFTVMGNEQSMM